MSDMSPLQRLLLKAVRYASLGAAILLFGFLVLALWQKLATGLTSQDYGFCWDCRPDASRRHLAVSRDHPRIGQSRGLNER